MSSNRQQSGNVEDYSKSFTQRETENNEQSIKVGINAAEVQKNKKMSDLSPTPTKDETREQSATYENCVDSSLHRDIEPCSGSDQESSGLMEFQDRDDEEEVVEFDP